MRYRLRHSTVYRYESPVVTSFHRVHLAPRHGCGQRVQNHRMVLRHPADPDVDPGASVVSVGDHFGNRSQRFDVLYPYDNLEVAAYSDVLVERRPPSGESCPWELAVTNADPSVSEFRFDSTHIERDHELADYARRAFTPKRPLLEAAFDLCAQIHNDCTYLPQSTDISTPPLTTLRQRVGVCQDFAHLAIASLRSIGVPAAYISGYLETVPPAGQERLLGADASHAWFAVWDPERNWVHLDPTNACWAGEKHIVTAIGRDFADVSPIIGILYGGGTQTLEVAVDVIPEAEWEAHPLRADWPLAEPGG